jgi:hypothetical protein
MAGLVERGWVIDEIDEPEGLKGKRFGRFGGDNASRNSHSPRPDPVSDNTAASRLDHLTDALSATHDLFSDGAAIVEFAREYRLGDWARSSPSSTTQAATGRESRRGRPAAPAVIVVDEPYQIIYSDVSYV